MCFSQKIVLTRYLSSVFYSFSTLNFFFSQLLNHIVFERLYVDCKYLFYFFTFFLILSFLPRPFFCLVLSFSHWSFPSPSPPPFVSPLTIVHTEDRPTHPTDFLVSCSRTNNLTGFTFFTHRNVLRLHVNR